MGLREIKDDERAPEDASRTASQYYAPLAKWIGSAEREMRFISEIGDGHTVSIPCLQHENLNIPMTRIF